MNAIYRRPVMILSLFALAIGCSCSTPAPERIADEVLELNVLGTAYLGQQKWAEAEQKLRQALERRPEDPLLLNNVAVGLMQQGRIDEAQPLLDRAIEVDPAFPYAHYNLGLIHKNSADFESAAKHFLAVASVDADDLFTQYNLGVVLSRLDRGDEAERAFRKALELDPSHVSSLYGLGRFLLQRGQAAEGTEMIARSQEIRARSGLDTAVGMQYGEQGPYAMGAEYSADVVPAPAPIPVSYRMLASLDAVEDAAWVVTRSVDPAAPPALLVATDVITRLSASGSSHDVAPAPAEGRIAALLSGDIDGDGTSELAAILDVSASLRAAFLRPDGEGYVWALDLPQVLLVEGNSGSRMEHDSRFVDLDHDGDLDLFTCWSGGESSGCTIATNDASGRFDPRPSVEHGFDLAGMIPGPLRVGFSDIDNDRDVDLLLLESGGVHLFTNQRDGTFDEISERVGLGPQPARLHAMAVADLNKDGWMDLALAASDGTRLLVNRRGRFVSSEAPGPSTTGASSLIVFDFDNDGFLDLLHSGTDGTRLDRNAGEAGWIERELLDESDLPAETDALSAFDADGDGDLDLALRTPQGRIVLLSNEGGNANGWIDVDLRGVGDNRDGLGAKVQVLSGGLRQKFEVQHPLPLHAGLGGRSVVQSVRILWPGGVIQDEVNESARRTAQIEQLDRKGTSCPLLYAWRDGAWRFVTDFLGGAAVGYQYAPGMFNMPDSDEYVKVVGGLTADDGGKLRLRLNNQLEEVIWFDQVELLAIDHPEGSEVYPNERLMPGPPWPEFELFASSNVRPIRSARGVESGRSLGDALLRLDRTYVDDFELLPYKGYSRLHTLEIDLGPFDADARPVLLLDGWIDYADSSANVAAGQAGAVLVAPRLLVTDGEGGWKSVERRMGFPAGLPKTMAVELDGLFSGDDRRLRIETSMRIYFDRARLMLVDPELELRTLRLRPEHADLRIGGFPRESSPDGRRPLLYDAQDVARFRGWKAHVGGYTAEGEVTDLIAEIDDRFVTTRSGDEIELLFAAPDPPPQGWIRSYLLFADGFGKDMDPNSAAAGTVGPMPFHGMPSYPYPEEIAPPESAREGLRATRRVPPSALGWPGAPPAILVATEPDGPR